MSNPQPSKRETSPGDDEHPQSVDAPRVSVVMSVFNGASQLADTVESLLEQSFRDFEFIIVNDGSSDESAVILERYAAQDERIVVVHQQNSGLTRALINGCARARGQFIARQDVGDRSLPQRLEKQCVFLDANPDVVAVGAGCRRVGPEGEYLGELVRHLTARQVTDALLDRGEGISHTVAMFRRDAYESVGGYRGEFRFAQDSDLWHRMTRVGMLGEVPEVLFEWGIDVDGISSSHFHRQSRLAELARASYDALQSGESDQSVLREAAETSWGKIADSSPVSPRRARGDAEYFIGSQLYELGDRRCRTYFKRAIGHRPFWIQPWGKLLLSYVRPGRTDRADTPE